LNIGLPHDGFWSGTHVPPVDASHALKRMLRVSTPMVFAAKASHASISAGGHTVHNEVTIMVKYQGHYEKTSSRALLPI
jgi:hypothetical protein